MKILVTGGSGFLGVEIIKKLLSRGFKVSNLDLISNNNNNIQNFQIDILDKNSLELVFKNNNFDIVIHSCAKVPISKSNKNFNEVNVLGTKNVLELTKKYKIGRFVYVSSSAVYGVPKKTPIKEDDNREPVELYGFSKKQGEDLCFNEMNNTSISIIRPRTVIGGDRLGIFSILFEWIKSDLPVPVLNNGNNLYQFVDVDDLAEAICLTGLSKYVGSLNIGSNSFTSVRDILSRLIEYNSSKSIIKNLDSSLLFNFLKFCIKYNIVPLKEYHYLAYGKDIYFDTSLSKKVLNWEPSISNFESLNNSYNNFINKNNTNLENQAVHRKPLKSLILKYASNFL